MDSCKIRPHWQKSCTTADQWFVLSQYNCVYSPMERRLMHNNDRVLLKYFTLHAK